MSFVVDYIMFRGYIMFRLFFHYIFNYSLFLLSWFHCSFPYVVRFTYGFVWCLPSTKAGEFYFGNSTNAGLAKPGSFCLEHLNLLKINVLCPRHPAVAIAATSVLNSLKSPHSIS